MASTLPDPTALRPENIHTMSTSDLPAATDSTLSSDSLMDISSVPEWILQRQNTDNLSSEDLPLGQLRAILDKYYKRDGARVIHDQIIRAIEDQVEQICRGARLLTRHSPETEGVFREINFLAALPEGLPLAAKLIMYYCRQIIKFQTVWRFFDLEALRILDLFLSKLLQRVADEVDMYPIMSLLRTRCEPTPLWIWQMPRFEERGDQNKIDVRWFRNTRYYLGNLHTQKVGPMLVRKVVGQRLPEELIGMVITEFYGVSDTSITKDPKAVYETTEDGQGMVSHAMREGVVSGWGWDPDEDPDMIAKSYLVNEDEDEDFNSGASDDI